MISFIILQIRIKNKWRSANSNFVAM